MEYEVSKCQLSHVMTPCAFFEKSLTPMPIIWVSGLTLLIEHDRVVYISVQCKHRVTVKQTGTVY